MYELENYATAQQRYELLIAERNEVFESFYEEVNPSFTSIDPSTGRLILSGYRTEDMAIKIIGKKEAYQSRINRELRKAAMFKKALKALNEREILAIQYKYLNVEGKSHFRHAIPHALVSSAEKKLCKIIKNEKNKEVTEKLKQKRLALKKQVESVLQSKI